jgi:hypothetical protein
MSGKLTCEKVAKQKEQQKSSQKTLDTLDSVSTLGFNKVFDTGTSIQLPKDDRAVNILTNNLKKIKETIANNFCQNIQDVSQKNEYIQPSSCYTAINKNCEDIFTGIPDKVCLQEGYKFLDQYSYQPIEQSNINKQRADCEINSIIGVLTEEEQNLDNLALIKLLQEKSNKFSDNDNSCSEISSDITEDKYIRAFLECSNKTAVKQQNIIKEDCFPLVTSQTNFNQDIKKCLNNLGIINNNKINLPSVSNFNDINSSKYKSNLPSLPSLPSLDNLSMNFSNEEKISIIAGVVISILILSASAYFIFKSRPIK